MAGPSILPLISKTFLRLAQIHGSLFILTCQSTKLLATEGYGRLRKASDFIMCFVEVADPRLHPVPQTFSPV